MIEMGDRVECVKDGTSRNYLAVQVVEDEDGIRTATFDEMN